MIGEEGPAPAGAYWLKSDLRYMPPIFWKMNPFNKHRPSRPSSLSTSTNAYHKTQEENQEPQLVNPRRLSVADEPVDAPGGSAFQPPIPFHPTAPPPPSSYPFTTQATFPIPLHPAGSSKLTLPNLGGQPAEPPQNTVRSHIGPRDLLRLRRSIDEEDFPRYDITPPSQGCIMDKRQHPSSFQQLEKVH